MQATTPPVARVLALLAVLILLFTACGGGDGPVVLRLTFDGGSCAYEGPTELSPGPVELVFVNESEEGSAWVNMVILDEGYTIQDVIDDRGPDPSLGHQPEWARELGTGPGVEVGESGHWELDLEAGLYAMVCGPFWPLHSWFGTGLTVEG